MNEKTVPGKTIRVCHKLDHEMLSDYDGDYRVEVRRKAHHEKADVVTSMIDGSPGRHAPVLDLDISHAYVKSSTDGHAHLYLDLDMSWWQYKRLLRALGRAGVLEKHYVQASLARKHTSVRLPWVRKKTSGV